jgi:AcrR family transcriptional regulator
MTGPRVRVSAEERREEVVRVAMEEFARGGFDGTPTEAIATRVGISQPYLFRLFRTKKELFLAAVDGCFVRTLSAFRGAAEGHTGVDAMHSMGDAYAGLLEDRTVLLLQLQAYVACEDPDIREHVRAGFRRLTTFVAEATDASDDDVRAFFQTGMLMNVVAAMELDRVDEPWARSLLVETTKQHVKG